MQEFSVLKYNFFFNLVRWLAPGHGGRGATFRLVVQIFTGGEIKAASTSLPLISILMVAWHRRWSYRCTLYQCTVQGNNAMQMCLSCKHMWHPFHHLDLWTILWPLDWFICGKQSAKRLRKLGYFWREGRECWQSLVRGGLCLKWSGGV